MKRIVMLTCGGLCAVSLGVWLLKPNYLPDTAPVVIAVKAYKIDTGTLPDIEKGLFALIDRPSGRAGELWKGPYIKASREELSRFIYKLDPDASAGFTIKASAKANESAPIVNPSPETPP